MVDSVRQTERVTGTGQRDKETFRKEGGIEDDLRERKEAA